jgi:RNA polymerase sigma-70 factor (ECF subfamily)
MEQIDPEIIHQAAKGDIYAFQEIYRLTSGFVYNVIYRILDSRDDAADVTQDVFVKIYNSLPDFSFRSSFKTWIYRIAVNAAYDRGRGLSRERALKKQYSEHCVQDYGPEQEIPGFLSERKELLSRMLESLNQAQRSCIVLCELEGLSYQEIADTLKININTVRTHIRRAREKLVNLGATSEVAHEMR